MIITADCSNVLLAVNSFRQMLQITKSSAFLGLILIHDFLVVANLQWTKLESTAAMWDHEVMSFVFVLMFLHSMHSLMLLSLSSLGHLFLIDASGLASNQIAEDPFHVGSFGVFNRGNFWDPSWKELNCFRRGLAMENPRLWIAL